MAIQVKRGGVWTTPTSGSISIKSGGVWRSVTSLSTKTNSAAWLNSGYVAYPSAPTNFRATSVGNGDNRQVTFAWNAGAGGAPVTDYVIKVYNSSDVRERDVPFGTSTSGTITFNNDDTTYYVRIFSKGTAGETQGSPRLRVVVGKAGFTTPNFVWSNETYSLTPTFLSQSSGRDGANAFDGNLSTVARGQSWDWPSPDDNGYREGMAFQVYASHFGTPTKMLLVYMASAPADNPPAQVWWDLLTFPTWTELGYTAGTGTAFGYQFVTGSRFMNAGATEVFRVHYNSLGYNRTDYGDYQWRTREIAIGYKIEINSPIYTAPTNTAVFNA
jgi:hypothetical protein